MISRRDLLKGLSVAGAAAVAPVSALAGVPAQSSTPPARGAFETLTAAEGAILEAVTERLIPSDASGPGAKDARAAHYIDRALAGPLSASRPVYASGLAALDDRARTSRGAPFARLSPADQDAVLAGIETTPFFALLRAHTIEGTFSDPYYGGNANFAGWDLIGYPGVRVAVAPAEQQLNVVVPPNHKSAYDFGMFNTK